ncbi:MAG: hypothetical protein B5M53_12365 [Candidatus Cloacimonas sp. 4484_209]|nr:MAG: hypothetical protein B5M53_12365 [Candidatus Cloacimonas sp. 4484_209]
MVGVIIAAGKGGRLSKISGELPKTLLNINGKPIIQWIIDKAKKGGIKNFIIVTGYNSDMINKYFTSNPDRYIKLVYNPLWKKSNGISVLTVEKMIKKNEHFILMMSDHLFGENIIKDVIKQKKRCPFLVVEKNINKVFDLKDATKVYIKNDTIVSIGKKLRKFNGVDTGIFCLDFRIFNAIKKSISQGNDSLTSGIKEFIKEHKLSFYSIPENVRWIDIDTERAYRKAKKMWR